MPKAIGGKGRRRPQTGDSRQPTAQREFVGPAQLGVDFLQRGIGPRTGAGTGEQPFPATGRSADEFAARRAGGRGSSSTGVGGPGGFGGFGGIDLSGFKSAEIGALNRLLDAKFGAVRTQLEGEQAQLQLGLDRFIQLRDRQRDLELRGNRSDVVSRGILDSGIFLKGKQEIETAAAEDVGSEQGRVGALVGAIQAQTAPGGFIDQQRAAERAFERAQIERSYLQARLAGGR